MVGKSVFVRPANYTMMGKRHSPSQPAQTWPRVSDESQSSWKGDWSLFFYHRRKK